MQLPGKYASILRHPQKPRTRPKDLVSSQNENLLHNLIQSESSKCIHHFPGHSVFPIAKMPALNAGPSESVENYGALSKSRNYRPPGE
jgi:hypothetical protein